MSLESCLFSENSTDAPIPGKKTGVLIPTCVSSSQTSMSTDHDLTPKARAAKNQSVALAQGDLDSQVCLQFHFLQDPRAHCVSLWAISSLVRSVVMSKVETVSKMLCSWNVVLAHKLKKKKKVASVCLLNLQLIKFWGVVASFSFLWLCAICQSFYLYLYFLCTSSFQGGGF